MSDRLDEILAGCKRTSAVLARLPRGAGREPERDPYEPRPFQYTEEQQKEIAKYGRTLLCRECQNPDAWWDMDSGTPTCSHCGGEDGMVPSDACEKRFFADDEKQARDAKKRNDEYKDEENMHLSKIQPLEIPGHCAREDLWAANNRLNQCVVWLQMLTRDESPGGFRLHPGEVRTGRILLRAVCVQWAKEGFMDDNFGNPVLWAIGVGLQMVALRPEGFAMPSEHLRTRVTLQGLHDWLRRYRSEAVFSSYESTLSMTKVRGTDARLGALAAEHRVQRRAAFHELGDTPHKRYKKMLVLHKLVVNSGFYGHGVGLAEPVLKMRRPTLMQQAEQLNVRVWPLRRVVVGVDTAMAHHRSDTDTDAESVYEEDSVPASPQHALEVFDGVDDADADDESSKADDGGCRCARLPPAPMPVTEMPYAAENLEIAPGGESTLSEIDQQLAVAEQLADPLAHMALASGFGDTDHEDEDHDSNATHAYFLSSDGEYAASDALPEDIDLPDEVWEQQVEAERAELDAKEVRSGGDDDDDDDDDEQPPKLQPATKRKPIPLNRLKTATLAQVRACSQYWQKDASKAQAFYNRWKEESKAHREVLRQKLEEKKQKEEAFAAAQAARAARREEAQAAREAKEEAQAERREARGWNQFMEQAAKKERAEARLARGQSACFVTPTEELTDAKAGTVAKISVNLVLPTLRLPALKPEAAAAPPAEQVGELKAVRVKLAGTARPIRRAPRGKRKAPEEEEAPEPGGDPYARKFKERRR